ncbi:MAG: hypoxanthine phosphoribosyltransferase [Prevotellaceae bacterium]|jgi:hypoxanthine phosphoribosyltransferase|nr:hypoxanthine phosphoribosyltransferase [Prevotellaceae bacterium]
MNNTIQIKDKQFQISIPAEKIQHEVQRLADEINRDMAGKEPVFLVILNGAFVFASDLIKKIHIPCRVSFVKLASYEGTGSTCNVKEIIGLSESLENQSVVVVEDIVDTGITMDCILRNLQSLHAKEVRVASFFHKPEALQKPIALDYVGMTIPNDFIVGYGLDYDGFGRNLADIYTLIK